MSKETYEIECLYKALNEGVLIRPQGWRVWMSGYDLATAQNILEAGLGMAKEKDCMFKDCRLVRVTREVI